MKKITIAFIIASICMQSSQNIHAALEIGERNAFIILTVFNTIGFLGSSAGSVYHVKAYKNLKKELAKENLCIGEKELLENEANNHIKSAKKWACAAVIELLLTIGSAYGLRSHGEIEDGGYRILVDTKNTDRDLL